MEGRTFRVFVSSTFSDLKEERNALSRHVFPRLRALCESRGFKFQAVDLRWGVRDEAAAHQQALRICLDEIARCQELSPKPNFVVLLGDRYGWCPLPNAISVADMNALVACMTQEQKDLVLYPDNPASAMRTGWYRRDDNALPAPEYVLQSRSEEKRAFEDYEVWEPVERDLREALAGAAKSAGFGERYRTSATEHEIVKGALEAVDAQDHVFGFLRSIRNLEDVKAALAGAYAKQARELIDTTPSGSWDARTGGKQRELHEKLARRIGTSNVWPYEASWNAGRLELGDVLHDLPEDATPSLQADDAASMGAAWKEHSQVIAAAAETPLRATSSLCEAVWQRLSRVIALQMDALEKRQGDRLEVEQRAHAKFARDRARGFLGRKGPLDRIASYLSGGPARPLVVHGPSGCGKSALLARAIELARVEHPDAVIITRFVGAAPGASEARPLLHSLCLELTRAYGGAEGEVPEDYDKLVIDFPARLELARNSERPAFLFIDALDQLSDSNDGRKLWWLPHTLPPNVRVVVSTLPEPEYHCFPVLEGRAEAGDLVGVEKMLPEEGAAVLHSWLASARPPRKLTGDQPAAVLAAFEHEGLPLHLKLAFEEARRWHSYDGLPERVDAGVRKRGLPSEVPGLIRTLFDRLSGEHGPAVVSRSLGFLAAARHGLSDDELLELLWLDEAVKGEFDRGKHHELPEGGDALPAIVWSRLYFDLEPYLAHREVFGVGLLGFYHRQLKEVAEADHLVAGRKPGVHGQLADYFADRWERADKHALLELVEHLVEASKGNPRRLKEVERLCREASFLRLRCRAFGPHSVQQELSQTAGWLEAHGANPSAVAEGAAVLRQVANVVRQEAHWLAHIGEADSPVHFDDVVYNRLLAVRSTKVTVTAMLHGLELRLPLLHSVRMGNAERVLVGHAGGIIACDLSADGKRALSGSDDGTMRVWDVSTGEVLKVLVGDDGAAHSQALSADGKREISGNLTSCALSADGKRALSGSCYRDSLYVWDTVTGERRTLLEDHTGGVRTVALSANGQRALSGSDDKRLRALNVMTSEMVVIKTAVHACALSADGQRALSCSGHRNLCLWDAVSGRALRVLEGHTREVWACALSSDGGTALSGSMDRTLRVWDATTGATLRVLEGHTGEVTACALSADGRFALSGSDDKTLRVWDTVAGATLKVLEGHTDWVLACSLSEDGKRGLSGSRDRTLRVWDTASSGTREVRDGHTNRINACALSADGKRVLSASDDKTLRFWNTVSGTTREVLRGHTSRVTACALSANGRRALSGADDMTLRVWNTSTGATLKVLQGAMAVVTSCALSADGKRALAASANTNCALQVWDTVTGAMLQDLEGHTQSVYACALSADGKRALSGSRDTTLRVWDTTSGQTLSVLEGHTDSVLSCALSADGKRALSGSRDKTLRVWDTMSGRTLDVLKGHADWVLACALSADGKRALSGSDDMTLRAWDLENGRSRHAVVGMHAFRGVGLSDRVICAGDASGSIWLIGWENSSSELRSGENATFRRRPFHGVIQLVQHLLSMVSWRG